MCIYNVRACTLFLGLCQVGEYGLTAYLGEIVKRGELSISELGKYVFTSMS